MEEFYDPPRIHPIQSRHRVEVITKIMKRIGCGGQWHLLYRLKGALQAGAWGMGAGEELILWVSHYGKIMNGYTVTKDGN